MKTGEIISISTFDWNNAYDYLNPREVWVPHILISPPWVYGFYNTEKNGTLEELIAQDQVSVMNQWRRIIWMIASPNLLKKSKRKMNITFSMTCDINNLSDR